MPIPTFEEFRQQKYGQSYQPLTASQPNASQDQLQWQAAYTKAPDLATKNKIAAGYENAYGSKLFGTPTVNSSDQKRKDAEKAKNDIIDVAKQLQDVIANKDKYSPQAYEAAKNSLVSAITLKKKEADNLGASLTGSELSILSGQVPVQQEIGPSAAQRVSQFFTGAKPIQTGKAIEPDPVIQQKLQLLISGLQGKPIDPSQLNSVNPQAPIDNGKSIGGLVQNAGSDVKGILNSILGIPAQAIDLQNKYGSFGQSVLSGEGPGRDILQNLLYPVRPAIQEANQVLGEPAKGGDIVGRIGQRAYEKPVTTAMDIGAVLPFFKGKLPELPVKTSETGMNPIQDVIRKATDITSGGGSKEYIARTANNANSLPQNQVLLDEGILSHPTATGKITATSKSMNKYGSQIGEIYKNAKENLTGSELGKALDSELKDKGYDSKTIRFIKSYINDQGSFNLSKGDASIPQENAWKAAQHLEKSPPKMMKNPESAAMYKQLSQDAARIIRGVLSEKNPAVVDLNAKYSALADYMNNVLKDPSGISSQGGLYNTSTKAAKALIDSMLNTAYKASNPTKLIRDMRYKQGNWEPRKSK